MPRFSVYQLGRGSEPVIVVGRILPAVAFSISVGRLSVRQLSVVHCERYGSPRLYPTAQPLCPPLDALHRCTLRTVRARATRRFGIQEGRTEVQRIVRTLIFLGVVLCLPALARAQAAIAGEVRDTSGAVLP